MSLDELALSVQRAIDRFSRIPRQIISLEAIGRSVVDHLDAGMRLHEGLDDGLRVVVLERPGITHDDDLARRMLHVHHAAIRGGCLLAGTQQWRARSLNMTPVGAHGW